MGKSQPAAPIIPDYGAAARNQGVENIETARAQARLNTPNVYTPMGSSTVDWNTKFDQSGYDQAMAAFNNAVAPVEPTVDDEGAWKQYDEQQKQWAQRVAPTREAYTSESDTPTIRQTFTPEAQAAFEAQQRVQRNLAGLGEQAVGKASGALSEPFDQSGYDLQSDLGEALPLNYGPAMGQYGMAGAVGDYGQAQGGITGPDLSLGYGGYGDVVDAPGAGLYGPQSGIDTSGLAQMPVGAGMTAQNAIMARLQPQIAQQSAATVQRLANQGITPGSEAWNNEMRVQQQQQNDLYSQAAMQGIGIDMAANQQGYGQLMGQAGLYNQAMGQGFGQGISAQQAQNAAQAQRFGQAQGTAQFGNQAQLQQFAADMANQQAANQALAQNFGQGTATQQMRNQAMAQNYGQDAASAQLYNQAANQAYNRQLSAADFYNQAQQQRLQQALALRSRPINEIAALMSGSQIQMPQFQGYAGGGQIQAAPVFAGTQLQGQAAQDLYGQQMAGYNANVGGLYKLGGAALGGLMGGPLGAAAASAIF